MLHTPASESGGFEMRDARPSDSDRINHLCVEAYVEFRTTIGEANWHRLRETLSRASDLSHEGQLIVAADASGVLGVVLYVAHGRTPERNLAGKIAVMRTLAVSPLHRAKGIGHSLTCECIDRARKDGADAIALTTAEMMTVARPMYERLGFIKESDLGKRFGVPHARYVLRLG
jgi:ribosomal protein S18 acetylase RimI-like enzyme